MKAELCPTSFAGSEQLLGFLINWLAYHILGVDQNMAAIKACKSAEDAYLAAEKTVRNPLRLTALEKCDRQVVDFCLSVTNQVLTNFPDCQVKR
jgi:hypothetical protein